MLNSEKRYNEKRLKRGRWWEECFAMVIKVVGRNNARRRGVVPKKILDDGTFFRGGTPAEPGSEGGIIF